MATSELELKLTWENNVSFSFTSKRDAQEVKTVVSLDENGHIGTLFPHIEEICKSFFNLELADIATTMKS